MIAKHYLGLRVIAFSSRYFLLLLLQVVLFRIDVIGKPGLLGCEDRLFLVHSPVGFL